MTKSNCQSAVLAIGGLDPTGGAGLLVDMAAVASLGLHGAAVVAVSTVQDGTRFVSARSERAGSVRAGIEAALLGLRVSAVKTGALGSAALVETVAGFARRGALPNLVVDPVLRSTTGGVLLEERALAAFTERLLPAAVLITPNLPEAERLTGLRVDRPAAMHRAAERLLRMGARAVLLKGGHLPGNELSDLLVDASGNEARFTGRRIGRGTVRGTGCALASLIAGFLASGRDLGGAVEEARTRLEEAIARSRRCGPGPRVLCFTGLPPGSCADSPRRRAPAESRRRR